MGGNPATTETQPPFAGLTIEALLDQLPSLARVVSGGDQMRGASDEMLQAWAWGIMDATENVSRIIAEWRKANAG